MVPFLKNEREDYHVAVLDHMVLAFVAHIATVLALAVAAGILVPL